MRVITTPAISAAFVVSLAIVAVSPDSVDLAVVDRIKSEAFSQSAVMEHLRGLTDLEGPRLTGSPGFEDAAKWTTARLTSYGLIATVVYQAANRPDRLPRRALPSAPATR